MSSKTFIAIPTTRQPSGSRRTTQTMFSLLSCPASSVSDHTVPTWTRSPESPIGSQSFTW